MAWCSALWLLTTAVVFLWPKKAPIDGAHNMNWSVVVIAGSCEDDRGLCSCSLFAIPLFPISMCCLGIVATIWWVLWARLNYGGPRVRRGDQQFVLTFRTPKSGSSKVAPDSVSQTRSPQRGTTDRVPDSGAASTPSGGIFASSGYDSMRALPGSAPGLSDSMRGMPVVLITRAVSAEGPAQPRASTNASEPTMSAV